MSGFCSKEPRRRKGYILVFGALILFFILVPAAGLAVDAGMMYLTQSLLSAASDGASLAGARALSRGSDDAAQRANAEAMARTYLTANFPAGYMWSSNLTVTSVAATDSQYVRSITTTASVDLPLVFLRIFRSASTRVSTTSKATRRDTNIMFVMDRSSSLQMSNSCTPLKSAAINFVDKFAEGRDNVGLITFATSSLVDNPLSATFKTSLTSTLNKVVCSGSTNTAQALWQAYDALVALNQPGALNVILLFTDGLPTAVTETFVIKNPGSTCTDKANKQGAVYSGSSHPQGLYMFVGLAQPMASDLRVIANKAGCYFASNQANLYRDVVTAPTTDSSGNSLNATLYKSVTYSGGGLDISSSNTMNNGATNAADHAALRIRRGDPDPAQDNRSLSNVVIYTIGYGPDQDEILLKRMANDASLSPNPVAAGASGKYRYAGDATQLNDAFTRVASELLRLAQ